MKNSRVFSFTHFFFFFLFFQKMKRRSFTKNSSFASKFISEKSLNRPKYYYNVNLDLSDYSTRLLTGFSAYFSAIFWFCLFSFGDFSFFGLKSFPALIIARDFYNFSFESFILDFSVLDWTLLAKNY